LIKRLLSIFDIKGSTNSTVDTGDKDIQTASIALLVLVAKADHSETIDEQAKIIQLANEYFGMTESDQQVLLELAKDVSSKSTSLYEFTSLINQHYNETQKYSLIKSMWLVAFSDNKIDRYEEHLIRRVADLIYLPHVQFVKAKHEAGEQHKQN